ncbi:Protein of unknown function [Cotesia congregata]|uniref:Uncharacterized protein n=1 Tax=Cotesia congregata TaxID=51543 RepID=A0A8J2H7B5_COTCN|nr:Protein of unknown function [Cotesia congregata]
MINSHAEVTAPTPLITANGLWETYNNSRGGDGEVMGRMNHEAAVEMTKIAAAFTKNLPFLTYIRNSCTSSEFLNALT